ncbi:TIGR00282 family metallophosphoesterase [Candidatus Soleaferrea massiliensis]|uniref:TIGR00282 family metallophosphoesterase n=1 Tax=Candidatus Soleaferrea massiliensis TaxID=1470354 RepID=UPI00058C48A6|nr:TIGR00282 family metallophosphoesterase [Candidatus Soleaferrea massiliensis]
MNILAIGDIVDTAGCQFLREKLPTLKKFYDIGVVVANGENSAPGNGISPQSAEHILTSGVDVITTGNHVFRKKEIGEYLDHHDFVIRPANYSEYANGFGYYLLDLVRTQVLVINLLGRVYMSEADNPFVCVDKILQKVQAPIVLVDFHAEATSEKKAMGYFLDGRVSAVFGTHTHVQTADACVLPGGTGYITDLGMTGPVHSVLGVKVESIVHKFKTGMPVRFETASGACSLSGCIFSVDDKTGRCETVTPIHIA